MMNIAKNKWLLLLSLIIFIINIPLAISEQSPSDLVNLGNELFISEGKSEEAIKYFDNAIEIDPNYVYAYTQKGYALIFLGNYDEAMSQFDKSIKLDSKFSWAFDCKAYLLDLIGRYDEAIKCYDTALEIDPNDAAYLGNKGWTLYRQGNYEDAIKYFDKSISANPNIAYPTPCMWNGKGMALTKLGDKDGALKAFNKSFELSCKQIEIMPTYIHALEGRGITLYGLGRYDEAIQYLDKSLSIYPRFAPFWYWKGLAFLATDRKKEAKDSFAKAKEIGLGWDILAFELSNSSRPQPKVIITPGLPPSFGNPSNIVRKERYIDCSKINGVYLIPTILGSSDGKTAFFEIKITKPESITKIYIQAKQAEIAYASKVKEGDIDNPALNLLSKLYEDVATLESGLLGEIPVLGTIRTAATIELERLYPAEDPHSLTINSPTGTYLIKIEGDNPSAADILVFYNPMFCDQGAATLPDQSWTARPVALSTENLPFEKRLMPATESPPCKVWKVDNIQDSQATKISEYTRNDVIVSPTIRSADKKAAYFEIDIRRPNFNMQNPKIYFGKRLVIRPASGSKIDYVAKVDSNDQYDTIQILYVGASEFLPKGTSTLMSFVSIIKKYAPKSNDDVVLEDDLSNGDYVVGKYIVKLAGEMEPKADIYLYAWLEESSTETQTNEKEVVFPDPNLEAAIRTSQTLRHTPIPTNRQIYPEDL